MDTDLLLQNSPKAKKKMSPRYRLALFLLITSIFILLNEISDMASGDPYSSMVTSQGLTFRIPPPAASPTSNYLLNSTSYDVSNISIPQNGQIIIVKSLEKVSAWSQDIQPTALNVTSKTGRMLIYNRVPKCGSTTMLWIIKGLSQKNKYTHRSSKLYHSRQLSKYKQNLLEKQFNRYLKHGYHSYDRHMYYFNLTRAENFIWFNFIRDPVERFVSEFYYLRSPDRWKKDMMKKVKRPPLSWFNMKLDKCVLAEDPECLPTLDTEHELQLTYFCGQHPDCRKVGSRWALQQAKENVERYYSVVGLLEEMPLSSKVLQSYIPRFFKNVTSIPLSSGSKKVNVDKTKPSVSDGILSILRSRLVEDYEFYDFVKKRLHLQAKAIGASEDMAELKHL